MLPLLILTYVGFISLGLPDAVLGVAWPSLRSTFGLPQAAIGAVLAGSGVGYFVSGLGAGRAVDRLGVGTLLAVSSGLITVAMLGYAAAPVWPVFVACSFIAGLGSGAIDTGLNAFAASHFSARHVNWLHACYCVGASLGPLIATAALERTGTFRWGYAAIGALMLIMAAAFTATRGALRAPGVGGVGGAGAPDAAEGGAGVAEGGAGARRGGAGGALRRPLVWLQIAVFFVYTGAEITLGQWCFTLNTQARGIPAATAGVLAGAYWGSIGVGRFLLGFVVDRVGPDRLLRIGTLAALLGSALFAAGPAWLGAFGMMLAGLGLAPVYPTLMSRTPARLGAADTAHAVGFQASAAMLGGVAVPSLAGVVAARVRLEAIGLVVVAMAACLWLLHEALLRATRRPG